MTNRTKKIEIDNKPGIYPIHAFSRKRSCITCVPNPPQRVTIIKNSIINVIINLINAKQFQNSNTVVIHFPRYASMMRLIILTSVLGRDQQTA